MKTTNPADVARIELLLSDLRLPAIKLMWKKFAEQSDKEGWPAARFLAALAEHEIADRGRRRIERHLAEARLPAGKTLANFEFEAVPMVSKAQVMTVSPVSRCQRSTLISTKVGSSSITRARRPVRSEAWHPAPHRAAASG